MALPVLKAPEPLLLHRLHKGITLPAGLGSRKKECVGREQSGTSKGKGVKTDITLRFSQSVYVVRAEGGCSSDKGTSKWEEEGQRRALGEKV